MALGIEREQVATIVSQTSIEGAQWREVLQVQTRPLPPLLLRDENAVQ